MTRKATRKVTHKVKRRLLLSALVLSAVLLIPHRPEIIPNNQPALDQSPEANPGQSTPLPRSKADDKIAVLHRDFIILSKTVLESLPTVADLEKLSTEEAHHTPKPVIQAGIQLGKIAQAILDQPELKEIGADFYEQCADKAELPMSVRSLCFSNLERISKELGKPFSASDYPEDIVSLASKIPKSD